MFTAYNPRAASAYQRINVETSVHTMDQYQIVCLLFDGLMESIGVARGALARKDIAAKCAAVSKALRILQEGLTTGLDTVDGGELAANLGALYDYCASQLIQANVRNDDAIFQEVQRLIEPVAQAWKTMKQTPTAPASPATPVATTKVASQRAGGYAHLSLVGA
ncbi:flagellar export chaperone FliS [Rhodoferax sp.]|uniref:flagellar export chaperone FliS n=1 Tax=Rhodoferax sp. TaxID=50421 RepID=UPI002639FBAC|nr:flagellar export chaperone FliS [Rhodoferax sp.]MDD2925559.1 flagellar export chaperone FliS [Rhodoferax sp.]